jgi:hypothetical protein
MIISAILALAPIILNFLSPPTSTDETKSTGIADDLLEKSGIKGSLQDVADKAAEKHANKLADRAPETIGLAAAAVLAFKLLL